MGRTYLQVEQELFFVFAFVFVFFAAVAFLAGAAFFFLAIYSSMKVMVLTFL